MIGDGADDEGERDREGDEPLGSCRRVIGDDGSRQRRGRRHRPRHEVPRAAERRVQQQGARCGIQADHRRDPGDRRVGQRLRHEDRPDREAGDQIAPEPVGPVPGQRREERGHRRVRSNIAGAQATTRNPRMATTIRLTPSPPRASNAASASPTRPEPARRPGLRLHPGPVEHRSHVRPDLGQPQFRARLANLIRQPDDDVEALDIQVRRCLELDEDDVGRLARRRGWRLAPRRAAGPRSGTGGVRPAAARSGPGPPGHPARPVIDAHAPPGRRPIGVAVGRARRTSRSSKDRTTATIRPGRMPSSSVATSATSAITKPSGRKRRMRASSSTRRKPITALMTMAPRTAWGRSWNNGSNATIVTTVEAGNDQRREGRRGPGPVVRGALARAAADDEPLEQPGQQRSPRRWRRAPGRGGSRRGARRRTAAPPSGSRRSR